MEEINTACALGLRAKISASTDFCGLMFAEGNLYPSIPRKINKISAHRFKTYTHFCEYQASLRDWINLIEQLETITVIGCNAAHHGTSYDEMEAAYEFIDSISHLNRDQFLTVFQAKTETAVIPTVGQDFQVIEATAPADSNLPPCILTQTERLQMKRTGKKQQ